MRWFYFTIHDSVPDEFRIPRTAISRFLLRAVEAQRLQVNGDVAPAMSDDKGACRPRDRSRFIVGFVEAEAGDYPDYSWRMKPVAVVNRLRRY